MDSQTNKFANKSGQNFDVLVVGGGINGAISALAMAQKGWRVLLVDKSDFSSYTSQESSSLAWGGIKYMESYEFGLVSDLCRSRNQLMRAFAEQVKEIRFFVTLDRSFRKPRFLVYLGAWLYWFIGLMFTRPPRLLSVADIQGREPIIKTENSQGGIEYSDAYFYDTDARFVFNLIQQAKWHGAECRNYCEAVSFQRSAQGRWQVELASVRTGTRARVEVAMIVNAAGPFADQVNERLENRCAFKHVFSKGVHLIVPRLTDHKHVLTFFADDGRMFFVIPMGDRSCIGTTDTRVPTLPPVVTEADRSFILENINKRLNLREPLTAADVIAERCGVRPLVVPRDSGKETGNDDWISLSRKHEITFDRQRGIVTIFGGKLTDCLNVGEEVCNFVMDFGLPTKTEEPLYDHLIRLRSQSHEFLKAASEAGIDRKNAKRLWRLYQQGAYKILPIWQEHQDAALVLFPETGLTVAEMVYMQREEQVVTLQDFTRRRSSLELQMGRVELCQHKGLAKSAQILFGAQSQQSLRQYQEQTIGGEQDDHAPQVVPTPG